MNSKRKQVRFSKYSKKFGHACEPGVIVALYCLRQRNHFKKSSLKGEK